MPTRPQVKVLTNVSVDVVNAIRNSASQNFKDYVPIATPDAESIRSIGAIIMDHPELQNEFLSALVNRIGRVMITSKLYSNPWADFKKGMLEFGESIEEVFVDIAKPFQFDPAVAETNLFKREKPDVKSAFHIMNFQKFYKSTIQNAQLKQAFLSWDGITDLIARIVDAMYTGANYDEFLTMKYLLARSILNGNLKAETIADYSNVANMKSVIATIKGVSNDLEFLSTKYNRAGVHTHTLKPDQYIIVNAKFDAVMDVEVLASAFNMDKAEFMGRRILVDSFGTLDTARLSELFADDPAYTALEASEIAALDAIPAVIVDKDWFMIFDNFVEFTEAYNGEGLYWNYFYHVWKTFSVSPFGNAVMFVVGTPSVTSVTVSPSTATVSANQSIQLTATVVTTNFESQAVTWTATSTDTEDFTISDAGVLRVGSTVTANDVITVKATSVKDATKYATATITVA